MMENVFFLDSFNLVTLVSCQAAMEDWCSKFQDGQDTGYVYLNQLESSSTKSFESNEDPKVPRGPFGDGVYVFGLAKVTSESYTQEPRLINDFNWVAVGKKQLWEKVIDLCQIEGDNLGLPDVTFHLVILCEFS